MPPVIALIREVRSGTQLAHTVPACARTRHGEIAHRMACRVVARGQRPLRKKYTWLVQSISSASPASEIRARTSLPMSAGEIVFSSTKITPPPDGVLALHVQDVVLHLEGKLIRVAIGTPAPVGQPLNPALLSRCDQFVRPPRSLGLLDTNSA